MTLTQLRRHIRLIGLFEFTFSQFHFHNFSFSVTSSQQSKRKCKQKFNELCSFFFLIYVFQLVWTKIRREFNFVPSCLFANASANDENE